MPGFVPEHGKDQRILRTEAAQRRMRFAHPVRDEHPAETSL
jgi:hypothetical protein